MRIIVFSALPQLFQREIHRDPPGPWHMLLPAGNSVHMEAGIAYGWGKKLVLIGEPEKPETLYLVFQERYKNIEEFLAAIN